jgi:hypothetical protein
MTRNHTEEKLFTDAAKAKMLEAKPIKEEKRAVNCWSSHQKDKET